VVCYTIASGQREVRIIPPREGFRISERFWGTSSTLPVDRYHALADSTMDTLLESLEVLLDDMGDSNYEVEYHVR
jgi:hypothetical protein